MNSWLTIASLVLSGILLSGCGSSVETTQQETSGENQSPPPAAPPAQAQTPVSVETRTDTIATIHQQGQEPEPPPKAAPNLEGPYRVQVGAFRKAANATALETMAKGRFGLPTTSEYSEKLSVYRVRVGGFRTMRDAMAFKNKLKTTYPGQFEDAWVVNTEKER